MTNEQPARQHELAAALDAATQELMDELHAFDQQQINIVPYPGSWTAAQVAEHLFKSDSAVLKALYGPTKESSRQPDKYAEGITRQFLDFSIKMDAPEIAVPADIHHEKEALISALYGTRNMLKKAVRTLELPLICTDPVMSGIVGEWTRLEYFTFVVVHTKRHLHQLQKIHAGVEK